MPSAPHESLAPAILRLSTYEIGEQGGSRTPHHAATLSTPPDPRGRLSGGPLPAQQGQRPHIRRASWARSCSPEKPPLNLIGRLLGRGRLHRQTRRPHPPRECDYAPVLKMTFAATLDRGCRVPHLNMV
eukprot:scaffold88462_cov39-Tisochrysis_lutea.AAC.1